jgi:hypothetical protein
MNIKQLALFINNIHQKEIIYGNSSRTVSTRFYAL